MAVMDGVSSASRVRDAAVNCTGKSTHPTSISDQRGPLRITAVKLGTLVTYDSDGIPHGVGSGAPTAMFKTEAAGSLVNATNMTLGFIDVGAGNWMAFAKAEFQGEEAACQLETASDFDRSEEHPWGDVAAQVVHVATSGETFRFRCVAPGATSSNPAQFRAIHLTAFRLGSLQNVAM